MSTPATEHPDLIRLASRRRSRAADVVSVVLDPFLVTFVGLVVLSVRAAGVPGLGWALLAAVFCVGIPEGTVRWWVRRGRVGDRQLVQREQRHLPLLVAAGSVALGVVVLLVAGAPSTVTAFVLGGLTAVAVMAALTRVVKASFHAGVIAAVVSVFAVDGLPAPLVVACVPLVVLVGWARVRAGRHTVAQVLLGVATCAVVVTGVFILAR